MCKCKSKTPAKWASNEEIKIFREYLCIPSVHPSPNYAPCIKFLQFQAKGLNLPVKIVHPLNENNPVVIMTWKGTQPELPSIMLNSHMDVVPVFEDKWTHPPFEAHMDEEGNIYARGTQDMKSVGTQYLAAIRALKSKNVELKRTIHVIFVPDEERGGEQGMAPFTKSQEFKNLNIGFSLDEGIASETDVYKIFYGERTVWRIYFRVSGTAGHGSLLLENTAGAKLDILLTELYAYRREQEKRLKDNPDLKIGDVTTVNLTRLSGGIQSNVVPPEFVACFDMRVALDNDLEEYEAKLNGICEKAGGGIILDFEKHRDKIEPTKIDDSNPFWLALKKSTEEMGLKTSTEIFPGGTDSRYIRDLGIPALGFSPINNTQVLLHDHNEYLNADIYLRGIGIYEKLITDLGNV